MPPPVFRFAPSPNGYLHLGHAASALLNSDLARQSGGRFLLRIEDIDTARCRPDYEAAIYDDLAWLGLVWETPVRRQSEHFPLYRAALQRLARAGLIYPAYETRAEIARLATARDPDGAPRYPGRGRLLGAAEEARRAAAGAPHVLRLDMTAALALTGPLTWNEQGQGERGVVAARPQDWGDVVLARKDTPTSYHLSVVVDDAEQGVSHVVRGLDLFHATAVHRLLQSLLGLPAPIYRHHPLIMDKAGAKLSKSTDAISLRSHRAAGATPADIRRMAELAAAPGA
jgi:glutamyl-Q tRNA(Asp) synthetase